MLNKKCIRASIRYTTTMPHYESVTDLKFSDNHVTYDNFNQTSHHNQHDKVSQTGSLLPDECSDTPFDHIQPRNLVSVEKPHHTVIPPGN